MLPLLTLLVLTSAPSPPCQLHAAIYGGPNDLGQYQLRLTYPPKCTATLLRARLVTRNGGIIPPIGEFRLSAGYPRQLHYWVFPGAHAQQQVGSLWRDLPMLNIPRGWF